MLSPDGSSYPTVFRQPASPISAAAGGGGGSPAHPAPPASHPIVDLPVLDLEALDAGSLAAACRDWGVFRLVNHGIPHALCRRLHDEARRLLALPFEDKRARFAGPAATYFFGTPAVSLGVRNINLVEGLHVPLGRPAPPHPPSSSAGGGHDLGDSAGLRDLAEEYGRHSSRVVRTLFESLATELGLDVDRRASYLSDSGSMLRLLRYPRCADASGHLGMDAHTDSSVLTTVSEDEVGGLQLLRGQTWWHVKPAAGTLVVNVGDMLQAMSDNSCRSAEHRVVTSRSTERFSICYFAFPREDAAIVSSKYREFTYRQFKEKVQEDIRDVGFKVGLERFKLSEPN